MESFIDILLQRIQREYERSPPQWTVTTRIPARLEKWIQKESMADSKFDTLQLRRRVLQASSSSSSPSSSSSSSSSPVPLYATCPYGSLVIFFEGQTPADVPWELWGRILRLFYEGQPATIYLLASAHTRQFPRLTETIKPQHVNGGYTYPCRNDTIVIYRAEDATRVLIHELQHATCLDHQEHGVDQVEAETEAWAEVLYTALMVKGDQSEWRNRWAQQWKWIQEQNRRVQRHMKSPESTEFPWRYTLGKEYVLRGWFSSLPRTATATTTPQNSLRLTAPPTRSEKKLHGVRQTSTML